MQWNVKKFDYTLKKVLDEYWDLADIAYFVDSDKGSDLNAGTYDAPFKTLGKAHSLITTNTGKVVMVNGVFDEILAINKVYRIVGAGGGKGGRALFTRRITFSVNNITVDNCFGFNFGGVVGFNLYNCMFNNAHVVTIGGSNESLNSHYIYFCIFNNTTFSPSTSYVTLWIKGNNNTFFQITRTTNNQPERIIVSLQGNNNHFFSSITSYMSNTGQNNIISTSINGNYLDPTNNNFNFLNTSPLFRTGTFNPEAQNYNHVGAGTEGMNHNALSPELNDAEDATYDNLTKDGSTIYRPDVDENGILTTGVIDMGEQRYRVTIDIENTIESASGVLYRKIQWSEGLTQREGLDYVLKIGNSVEELDTAVELLMEFGKEVTTSGAGANLKGNADPDFDPATAEIALFRYYILKAKFRTVTA